MKKSKKIESANVGLNSINKGGSFEEELKKQNAYLNAILNNSHSVIIFLLDKSYRYLEYNENHRREMKRVYNVDIQKGMNILDLINIPEVREKAKKSIDRVLTGESHVETEVQPDLNIYFEFHWNTVRKEGEIFGASCFVLDITDRKQAELKAFKAQKEWETIFNGMPHPTVILDSDHKIIAVNKKLIFESGKKESEIKNMKCWELFHKPGTICPPAGCPFEKMKQAGNLDTFEEEMEAFNGHYMISCTPILDDFGKMEKVIHIATDITERKKAEENLRISEKNYRDLVENSLVGIYTSNFEGDLKFANNALCDILEYSSQEELLSSKVKEFYIDENARNEFINKIKENGILLNYELDLKTKSGKIKNLIINSYLTGNLISGMILDVTERKQFVKELIKAKEIAEASNKLKSSFLANMSHELRTPMVAILGFSEMLSERLEIGEEKHMAEMIYEGGKRLTNTLNLILDLSRIESSKMEMSLKSLDISGTIESIINFYKQEAKRRYLKLTVDVKNGLYSEIDTGMLEKILDNLIQNALKYTEAGEIKISSGLEIHKNENYVFIKVKDSGIGIPKDKLNLVFEPFRQVSEGHGRMYEGTGLGLSITKKYVELLNGEISVDSEFGVGSEFKVMLPYKKYMCSNEEKIEDFESVLPVNIKSYKKILIVEDDDFSTVIISQAIKSYYFYDISSTGEEAIELSKTNKYSGVILDIGLSGINGIETLKEIRKINGYNKIPIIATTAYAMHSDRELILEAGFDDYISKPFEVKSFLKTVMSHFR